MSLARQYNELLAHASRQRQLPGVRELPQPIAEHHWKTTVRRRADNPFQWGIFVAPGTVNDRMAAISYLPENDPRGWSLTPDYPGLERMRRLYGNGPLPIVDRLLTETESPPHLLATAPGFETSDRSDFVQIPDGPLRPPAFRSKAMWELQLYQSHVFITAESRRYSVVENNLGFPIPTRNSRYRVAVAAQMPQIPLGQPANFHELARLYLLRDPSQPGVRDRLLVQQRCFWSLWSARQTPFLDFNPFGYNPIIDAIVATAIRFLAAALSNGRQIPFWTAV